MGAWTITRTREETEKKKRGKGITKRGKEGGEPRSAEARKLKNFTAIFKKSL